MPPARPSRRSLNGFPTRTYLTRNINRFYIVDVALFGDWAVMREWGRRGSLGRVWLDSYE